MATLTVTVNGSASNNIIFARGDMNQVPRDMCGVNVLGLMDAVGGTMKL